MSASCLSTCQEAVARSIHQTVDMLLVHDDVPASVKTLCFTTDDLFSEYSIFEPAYEDVLLHLIEKFSSVPTTSHSTASGLGDNRWKRLPQHQPVLLSMNCAEGSADKAACFSDTAVLVEGNPLAVQGHSVHQDPIQTVETQTHSPLATPVPSQDSTGKRAKKIGKTRGCRGGRSMKNKAKSNSDAYRALMVNSLNHVCLSQCNKPKCWSEGANIVPGEFSERAVAAKSKEESERSFNVMTAETLTTLAFTCTQDSIPLVDFADHHMTVESLPGMWA